MDEKLKRYIRAFGRLNVARINGRAPHKPILLLAVLQAYRNGFIEDNKIYMTPELVALFKTHWSALVITNHVCRISYPFYYLKSDQFWKLVPKVGFEDVNQMGSIMKSFSNLMKAIDYAVIDEDLMLLALDQKSNLTLQQFLLDEYFPETKVNYTNMLSDGKSIFSGIEEKILNEPPEDYRAEIKRIVEQKDEEEIYLRGSLFKREIPKIYDNTCCITGMQIHTIVSMSMIDACHIVPFSLSYDDTITNGIALCPNLHRAFDRGLVTIDEQYKVVVSDAFVENETDFSIKRFHHKEILLPQNASYRPNIENLHWHRRNVFKE